MEITKNQVSIINFLSKLPSIVFGLALLAYVIGFVITNMYLSSISVVNFDVIRIRYTLVGLIFILFLLAIVYLIYGLFKGMRKKREESTFRIIRSLIWYSFENLGVLYIVAIAMNVIANSKKLNPLGINGISQPKPWEDWINNIPIKVLQPAAYIFLFLTIILFLIIFLAIAINPKKSDGTKNDRKSLIKKIFNHSFKEYFYAIAVYFCVFSLFCIYMFAVNLMDFYTSINTVNNSQSVNLFSSGSGSFFGGITLIYVIIASYIFLLIISKRLAGGNVESISDNPIDDISAIISIIAFCIILILPFYTYSIYPNLPQQFGGGKMIPVYVELTVDSNSDKLLDKQKQVSIIDRANDTTIFFQSEISTNDYRIIEIPNSLIKSITYDSTY